VVNLYRYVVNLYRYVVNLYRYVVNLYRYVVNLYRYVVNSPDNRHDQEIVNIKTEFEFLYNAGHFLTVI
jgi:hypothetical protein